MGYKKTQKSNIMILEIKSMNRRSILPNKMKNALEIEPITWKRISKLKDRKIEIIQAEEERELRFFKK